MWVVGCEKIDSLWLQKRDPGPTSAKRGTTPSMPRMWANPIQSNTPSPVGGVEVTV
jgi:hypothetical protein